MITKEGNKVRVTTPDIIAEFYEGNEWTDPVINAIRESESEANRFYDLLLRRFTADENPLKAGELKGVSLAIKDFRGISDAEYNQLMGIEP